MEVKLIDYMGDDLRVVNAARVSFHRESDFVKTDEEQDDEAAKAWKEMTGEPIYKRDISEQDQKLISYLAKHNHWTPFSHVQITLREKVPIFVARQRFKHMVGFTYNEVSRRYVDDVPEFYVPDAWRGKPINAKQGSSEEVISDIYNYMAYEVYDRYDLGKTDTVKRQYDEIIRITQGFYQTLIDNGVAPEQARMVLPQSMYTEYYCTGSLAAWARAYRLRIDSHAQKEIQDLARMWQETIGGIKELEYSWKALTC